jgi:hypothetical protein
VPGSGLGPGHVSAQTIIDEWAKVKVAPAPDLKPVTVTEADTALLVLVAAHDHPSGDDQRPGLGIRRRGLPRGAKGAAQLLLGRLSEVLQLVQEIGQLLGLRRARASGVPVMTAAIPADDLNIGMLAQPPDRSPRPTGRVQIVRRAARRGMTARSGGSARRHGAMLRTPATIAGAKLCLLCRVN